MNLLTRSWRRACYTGISALQLLLPISQSTADEIEAQGYAVLTIAASPGISYTNNFRCRVRGENYMIEFARADGAVKEITASDGKQVYRIAETLGAFTLADVPKFNRLQRDNLERGTICDGDYPKASDPNVQLLWLLFKRRTFSDIEGGFVEPIKYEYQVPPILAYPDIQVDGSPYPKSIRIYAHGYDLVQGPSGRMEQIPLPEPYSKGFLTLECRIDGTTNLQGHTFPTRFSLTSYFPKDKENHPKDKSDVEWANALKFEVTNIVARCEPFPMPPKAHYNQAQLSIFDYRHEARIREHYVSYYITNGAWPAKNSQYVLGLVGQEPPSRLPGPPKYMYGVMVIVLLGPLISYVARRYRKKQNEQKEIYGTT